MRDKNRNSWQRDDFKKQYHESLKNYQWDKRDCYDDKPWPRYNYGSYQPPKKKGWFVRLITNKFLIQAMVSVIVFMLVMNFYDVKDPFSTIASRTMHYLLNTDVEFEPLLDKIVKIALPDQINEGPLLTDKGETLPATTTPMSLPLSGKIIKSYGWAMDDQVGYPVFNEGIVVAAEVGKEVKAVLNGHVNKVGEDPVLGKYVIIDHGNQLSTLYGYLSEVNAEAGELVQQGDVLGLSGQSGTAEVPSLYFQIIEKNQSVNPLDMFNQGGV